MDGKGLIGTDDFRRIGPMQLKARVSLPSTSLVFEGLLTGSEGSGYDCVMAIDGVGPYSGFGADAYAGHFPSVDAAAARCSELAEKADGEDIRVVLGVCGR